MKDSFMELRVICKTVKELRSWLTNHNMEPDTIGQNKHIKMGVHESSKSQTPRFMKFETLLHLNSQILYQNKFSLFFSIS